VYQKSLGLAHDEPNKPTKGKDSFHMCSWSPHLPPFQSWQEPLQFSLFGCIHEKANPDAGNPEEQIPSKKTEKNRMESYRWMTGIYTDWQSGGWWQQVFT
jgi:hypothetical protein